MKKVLGMLELDQFKREVGALLSRAPSSETTSIMGAKKVSGLMQMRSSSTLLFVMLLLVLSTCSLCSGVRDITRPEDSAAAASVQSSFGSTARHSTTAAFAKTELKHGIETTAMKVQDAGRTARLGEAAAAHHFQPNSGFYNAGTKIASNFISVAQTGSANFNSIQAAVDSVPENNAQWVEISIAAGVYQEKVTVPSNKPYIIFQGAGMSSTIISNSETASSVGTADSATVTIWATNFVAKGMGFENAAPPAQPGAVNGQAVAVLVANDMAAFYACGFYGGQDTLFDFQGRHYYKDCYIEGTVDFIFGDGQSQFISCQLNVKAQPEAYVSGSIAAQRRSSPDENTGFVFINCVISGTGEVYLGRAWGPYSRTIYMYTYMSDIIVPAGWQDWNDPSRDGTVTYGQCQCTGPGAVETYRVPWSHEFSATDVAPFADISWINGQAWLLST
jgi:pectinesterase